MAKSQVNKACNVGQGYGVMKRVLDYVKNNLDARFHNPSCHRNRKKYSSILLDIKF